MGNSLSIRANNPLSLVYNPAVKYQGLKDPPFLEHLFNFETPQLGIRAATLNLRAYAKRGIKTIATIIPVWSPPKSGNPTATYIENVEAWSGIDRNRVLTESDTPLLFSAMSRQEDGSNLPMNIIQEGIAMATGPQISVGQTTLVAGAGGLGYAAADLIQGAFHDIWHIDINASRVAALALVITAVLHYFFPKS